MLKAFLVGFSVMVGLGTARAAPVTELATNGGFEASSYAANSEFGVRYGGQGVTGWTGTGFALYFIAGTQATTPAANEFGDNQNLLRPNAILSPSGGNFVALDGDGSFQGGAGAGVSQTINGLTPGLQYDVSFQWAATQLQNRTGATTEQLQVRLGGDTVYTPVVSNPDSGFTGWFQQRSRFTATAASEVLSFLSIGTPNGLPPIALLDGVSVQQAVPEPASLVVLVAALAGLGGMARRRRA